MTAMDTNSIRRENLDALIRAAGSLTRLASLSGISAAYLSQIRTGHREMGSRIARRLEEALDINFGMMDLPATWQGFSPAYDGSKMSSPGDVALLEKRRQLGNIAARSDDGFVRIGLAGNGDVAEILRRASVRSMELSESFLRSLTSASDLTSLAIVNADDDSMAPDIMPGDALLLDTSIKDVRVDGIYLFQIGSAVHLKRIQLIKKLLVVKSDNPRYESWTMEGNEIAELIVHGRITASIPLSGAKRLG